jgi:hypothetical protein
MSPANWRDTFSGATTRRTHKSSNGEGHSRNDSDLGHEFMREATIAASKSLAAVSDKAR